mmetsp:Transcript_2949/g.8081  ORF Transcript_2949/g.8081 Transcript_2949/m.8081 type:complete len:237 (-) Transcript_2949:215-925(-)
MRFPRLSSVEDCCWCFCWCRVVLADVSIQIHPVSFHPYSRLSRSSTSWAQSAPPLASASQRRTAIAPAPASHSAPAPTQPCPDPDPPWTPNPIPSCHPPIRSIASHPTRRDRSRSTCRCPSCPTRPSSTQTAACRNPAKAPCTCRSMCTALPSGCHAASPSGRSGDSDRAARRPCLRATAARRAAFRSLVRPVSSGCKSEPWASPLSLEDDATGNWCDEHCTVSIVEMTACAPSGS